MIKCPTTSPDIGACRTYVSASTVVNRAGAEAVRDALARAVEGWE